jgi:hypothetical protein
MLFIPSTISRIYFSVAIAKYIPASSDSQEVIHTLDYLTDWYCYDLKIFDGYLFDGTYHGLKIFDLY